MNEERITVQHGRTTQKCFAFGCPLPGTWSNDQKGNGPWSCFVHSAMPHKPLQDVTQAILARLEELNEMNAEKNSSDVRRIRHSIIRSIDLELEAK